MEWGARIAVDGVRPDWLRDEDSIQFTTRGRNPDDWNTGYKKRGYGSGVWQTWDHALGWPVIADIRLPVDHGYYRRVAEQPDRYDTAITLLKDIRTLLRPTTQELTITITGPQGSGKTRWADLIRNLPAKTLGYPVPRVVDAGVE